MLKVYIACEFGRRDEAKDAADTLRGVGIDVVSTWHHDDKEYSPGNVLRGIRDFQQLKGCDVVLHVPGSSVNANCEVGIALGLGKHIVCAEHPRANIFVSSLPWITKLNSIEAAIAWIFNVYGGVK